MWFIYLPNKPKIPGGGINPFGVVSGGTVGGKNLPSQKAACCGNFLSVREKLKAAFKVPTDVQRAVCEVLKHLFQSRFLALRNI